MSAFVNLPLHHKVPKFFSGIGSPGWSRKRAVKWLWCGEVSKLTWDKLGCVCVHTLPFVSVLNSNSCLLYIWIYHIVLLCSVWALGVVVLRKNNRSLSFEDCSCNGM